MTTYRWKSETRKNYTSIDPQKVGEALQQLSDRLGDQITSQAVVTEATAPTSPLHGWFEWDNDKAANSWRVKQASDLMNAVVVVTDDQSPQPMFVSVVEEVDGEEQRHYATTARVFADSVLSHQILERAYGEMETFRQKYGQFKELAKIADAAQQEITTLMKSQEATTAA